MDEAVVCFFLTDDEKSSRIEKSVSYHFKLIVVFRIYQSMFCHENDHICFMVCQCEIFSKEHLEEPPNVIYKTGEHEQEVSYDTIGRCCVYPDFISNTVYGFYPPFFVQFHI